MGGMQLAFQGSKSLILLAISELGGRVVQASQRAGRSFVHQIGQIFLSRDPPHYVDEVLEAELAELKQAKEPWHG